MTPFLLESFDRRLDPASTAPIAVAYSGGGDSLMALRATKAWADQHGREVVALTVDHRLQAAGADWVEQARGVAARLGVGFRALVWDGEKPATGIPAAARAARHRLIAAAARGIGAQVVVFGHTADDLIENDLMRAEGLRLGAMGEWSPSPVWPQGRGVFLLRPLLGVRRADIRATLAAEGETWIDDPANEDLCSPRIRARQRAIESPSCPGATRPDDLALADLARTAAIGEDGAISLEREPLCAIAEPVLHRLLAAALTCAGGQAGPPRGKRLDALIRRLKSSEAFTATLGGAKILAGERVLIVRDAGEIRRGGLAPITIASDGSTGWDGRFEASAGAKPLLVRALTGRMKALGSAEQAQLRTLDAAVRPSLPVFEVEGANPTCPILAQTLVGRATSLVRGRFLAACAVISKEGAT